MREGGAELQGFLSEGPTEGLALAVLNEDLFVFARMCPTVGRAAVCFVLFL
jgi:hypothetical protein